MSGKAIERMGLLGMMAVALGWLEVERRRVLGELEDEREANKELVNDFRDYSSAMAKALAGE
jgi:hypothetical protein